MKVLTYGVPGGIPKDRAGSCGNPQGVCQKEESGGAMAGCQNLLEKTVRTISLLLFNVLKESAESLDLGI